MKVYYLYMICFHGFMGTVTPTNHLPSNPGIKGDLDSLGVSGGPGAHRLVGGIGHMPARVAGLHVVYPLELLEDRFEAPETAPANVASSVSGPFMRRLRILHEAW